LRTILGDTVLPQDRDQVALSADGILSTDRDEFLAALETGHWEVAINAYGGEFLEGFESGEPAFDRWADAERVRLRARYQEALLAAGESALADGRLSDALDHANRLTTTAPYDESAALFSANTLVAAGKSRQAVTTLRQFIDRIRDEFDLAPSATLRALVERLERHGARDQQTPSSGISAEPGKAPFVGRESELARMLALISGLKHERGATVLLEGEAGIGKSRLLEEFADRARNLGGVLLLRGREAGLGGVLPYAGLVDALRPIVRASGVAGASKHLLAEAARLLPELRDAFDLPAASPIEDETGRLRFFEGIAALIDAAAYERPVCVIVDDMHHASPSTIDLFVYLSRRLHESPVLFIASYRTERVVGAAVERLRALSDVDGNASTSIALGAFDDHESLALARAVLRGVGRTTDADVDRVVRASGGRPFAILELARRTASGTPTTELPASLRDILWARFQALSPSQRRTFFAASLLERSANLRVLAAAAHLPEAAAYEAVEVLLRLGYLRATDDGYAVAHDVTQGFLVDASGLAGRAVLASWAADALAAEHDASDAELASLYAMAGRAGDAFIRARAAAFAAAAIGASSEVARLLGIALTFAPTDAARREVDSLLTAFGRTRLTLPGARDHGASADLAPSVESTPVADDNAVRDDDVSFSRAEPAPPTDVRSRRSLWRPASTRQWVVSIAASLAIALAGYYARPIVLARASTRNVSDTLVLTERDARGRAALELIRNPRRERSTGTPIAAAAGLFAPAWLDSLASPWTGGLVSPDRQRVALQRVTPEGEQLLVVGVDRRDTSLVSTTPGDNIGLAWSPDSRSLLVSRSRLLVDGSLDTDLWRVTIGAPALAVPIDTSSSRAVAEAAWSPTGDRVAWVARVGSQRQRDVFVSRADGSDVLNVSSNSADDYELAWSPDGSLLAFTSQRDGGGSRLYVYDFDNKRLWPISDRSGESHAVFSPDGRSIAFEAVRDGDRAVYARPSLGGTPKRLTPAGRQFSIASWSGGRPQFIDRLRIVGPRSIAVGDTARLGFIALTPANSPLRDVPVQWSVQGREATQLQSNAADSASMISVVARGTGSARVIASIPGWRADTLTLLVSSNQALHFNDSFARIDSSWLPLGVPLPRTGRTSDGAPAVFPNGDLEWDSGLLLRSAMALRPGLHASVRVTAPFTGRPSATTLMLGFVAAAAEGSIDRRAPQFTPLVTVAWDGASGNLTYSVGPENFSEPAAATGAGDRHTIDVSVGADRSVVFAIDGTQRWKSSLSFLGSTGEETVAQWWMGGRATGSSVAISNVTLDQPAPRARSR